MKSPTSVRKVTLMIATVRNTSLAERAHECLAPSEAPGVNHSGEGGLRPPAVQPVLTAFVGFPDNHVLEMLALGTSGRQKIGMGGTRFDPGQHHPALTLRAAWPIDGKQGWVGMTLGFKHDASPALGGSATLSVTGTCRYEGGGRNQQGLPAPGGRG